MDVITHFIYVLYSFCNVGNRLCCRAPIGISRVHVSQVQKLLLFILTTVFEQTYFPLSLLHVEYMCSRTML